MDVVLAGSLDRAAIESPTHTESQPSDSASAASRSISAAVVAPMTTPRLGRVSPNFTLLSVISFIPRLPRAAWKVIAHERGGGEEHNGGGTFEA